jgi:hypothetical protein
MDFVNMSGERPSLETWGSYPKSSSKRDINMAIEKSIASSSLAEVIDRILDKGVVVDAFVRVALVGIELIAIEARVVIASVETWLKYAEAVGLVANPQTA